MPSGRFRPALRFLLARTSLLHHRSDARSALCSLPAGTVANSGSSDQNPLSVAEDSHSRSQKDYPQYPLAFPAAARPSLQGVGRILPNQVVKKTTPCCHNCCTPLLPARSLSELRSDQRVLGSPRFQEPCERGTPHFPHRLHAASIIVECKASCSFHRDFHSSPPAQGAERGEDGSHDRNVKSTVQAGANGTSSSNGSSSSSNGSSSSSNGSRNSKASSSVHPIRMEEFPPDRIRNFSIVAHIDHGKSTLADRLLELTGTINKGHGQPQYLDKLQVERERGITVKAQTASMVFDYSPDPSSAASTNSAPSGGKYLLNLIDTPGHVDFSYEVSRSLAATDGVLLLVDAVQGIQAQTVANFFLAFEAGLTVIPVINKVDQQAADPTAVAEQIQSTFDLDPSDCLLTSAKTGLGLENVLPAVVERIAPPGGQPEAPLRMLLLDAQFDEYRGVICHVAVADGAVRRGDAIMAASTGEVYEVSEVGIMFPELHSTGCLLTGQVGYIIAGMRSTREARVGDTLHLAKAKGSIQPLPGFRPAQHMVYAGLYAADGSSFEQLAAAVEKLTLNDGSVAVARESSGALGAGFRCGFLGLLHMDVFHQRLEQEFGAQVVSTAPTVPYIFEYASGLVVNVQSPADVPSNPGTRLVKTKEPTVLATIIAPSRYVGSIMTLCSERRGQQLEYSFIGGDRALLRYRLPVREVVLDFFDDLKSLSSGYATFDYEDGGYVDSDLVKLDLMLNEESVDALSSIVHRSQSQAVGRQMVQRLKANIERQMFEVSIQAAIGNKVIASEKISPFRKNVLAKCYGGDVTRKKKLLEKQKEGKKRMKRVGSVSVPQEAFHQLLKAT